jgi:hypothetical protein
MGFEKSSTGSFAGAASSGDGSWAVAAKATATVKPRMAIVMHPTRINIKADFVFIFTPLSIYTVSHAAAIVHNENLS